MKLGQLLILLVLLVLTVGMAACTPEIPRQREPADEPYDGERPAPRPVGIPEDWLGVRVYFYGHDRDDFRKDITFSFNILAVAANPQLIGGFVEPDTGRHHPFRDPTTGTNLMVTPEPKTTPYGFTVWFPPGESISFTIAYGFEGEWGDTVGCEFQRADGAPIYNTRTYAAVLDPDIRELTGAMRHATNLCFYVTAQGGPV